MAGFLWLPVWEVKSWALEAPCWVGPPISICICQFKGQLTVNIREKIYSAWPYWEEDEVVQWPILYFGDKREDKRYAELSNPREGMVLPIIDPSLSQLQIVLQDGPVSSQNGMKSHSQRQVSPLTSISDSAISFPQNVISEKISIWDIYCLNTLRAKERGTCVDF